MGSAGGFGFSGGAGTAPRAGAADDDALFRAASLTGAPAATPATGPAAPRAPTTPVAPAPASAAAPQTAPATAPAPSSLSASTGVGLGDTATPAPFRGGLAPTINDSADPYAAGDLVQTAPGLAAGLPSAFSSNPVRYADGVVELSFPDLTSQVGTLPVGYTRSWSNGSGYSTGQNGSGMVVTQLPHLVQDTGGTLDLISNGYTIRYFDPDGLGGYTERYYGQDVLTHDALSNLYVLRDTQGDELHVNDFSTSLPAAQRGSFSLFSDPNLNTVTTMTYTTGGKPSQIGCSVTGETYTFSYVASGVNAGLVASVVLARSSATVREADYTYYDGTESYGSAGDLKLAVIKDAGGNALDTTYYRYYTSNTSPGYTGGLKYLFRPDSYGRLTAALGTSLSSLTDAQVAPYADNYFEYDSSHRVTTEVAAGAGSSSATNPGQGTFTYSYTTSGNTPGMNSWAVKTTVGLPDGNSDIVYTNAAGEVMLFVYHDAGSSSEWATFYKYDSAGHAVVVASPSAVSGYNDTYADLLHSVSGNYQYLNDSTGLITLYDYATTTTATSTTAGDAAFYLQDTKVMQGETATPITVGAEQYYTHGGMMSPTVYPLANQTAYRNTNGTGGETTSYSYTWPMSGSLPQSVAVSRPVISSGQNGPGSADVVTTYYDTFGRPVWEKDGDGFLTYLAYSSTTGAVVKVIDDVNTADTGDFSGLPTGWTTPTGGGLELITTYTVDGLGRETQMTDPARNVTYKVYNDANHEVRTYPGWASGATTGPTLVLRYDRAGGYLESLTMSASPHTTSGVPDGTESIGSVQTLSRSYTNSGGQVTEANAYFNLSGVTYSTSTYIGTSGTNYYATLYGYDGAGRQSRMQLPTGTVERTVYDGMGRAVSAWVGLDDTPTSGAWSPSNTAGTDLVDVTDYQYDGGGVGDGNLTAVTQHPGGGAADRVTNDYYDWRDRLVATKDGVQVSEGTTTHRPITYYTYDNLDEVTEVQSYDGDGVTITSSGGVPQAPSSSLLRAQTVASYDDQGRVYQAQQYGVNPSTGSVSTYALTTNTFYNHRGAVIKTSEPGGLVTKTTYDGAGRATVVYTTDGGGDSSWSDAGTVTGDAVLEQAECNYDADGNVILTTTRQRNHDETTTGALGNASTTPKARVSYMADYYDAANRLTATADIGTNGGSSYTRPSSAPSRSDIVLVTSETYNAAGWMDSVTDPRGLVGKTYYDNFGRVTKAIEDYVDGTPSNNDDKTTEYTYDGDGHTLTVQADLVSGAYEKTQFVYGVTTTDGSALNDNDLLAATEHPDPSTGNPSTSSEETYTVNALGQTVALTDRNGSVHTYAYDVLGRETSDAVTTLGSGVDGAVRRIETTYDTQGNPYLVTSYDAASGGSVVNQVQRVYNGLGQLTGEYQSHSGAVNTSTTPEVQYAYVEISGGANNSRLTSITYPNGKVLTYNYASGLNDTISRLSSLSDSTGTLESYSYLGLDTVVIRSHPQPGIDLTYVKQTGESNGDAGDQYAGLDRFGRIVDQRWINTGTSTATDRFQYGYDRDGNALYKNNLVNGAFSELYHANGASNGYDGLNQLTDFRRGTLSDANSDGIPDTVTTASATASWSMDALGNFTNVSGTAETNNKQNEATAFGSATLTYDGNGNLTTDQNGNTLVYDAWNRLVAYKSGSTTLETLAYDGLGRRIVENPGTARDLYYSDDWQVLEERAGGSAKVQYVWSPVYVDALVLRDRDADGSSGNGLEERLWVQQDANWNVTALVNGSGSVVERDVYDPYGNVSVLSASWGSLTATAYAWIIGHQGGRWDATTGLYGFRNRDESAVLGRWVEMDPSGFSAGDTNLYRDVCNRPIDATDPWGLLGLLDDPLLQSHLSLMNAAARMPGEIDAYDRLYQRNGVSGASVRAVLAGGMRAMPFVNSIVRGQEAMDGLSRDPDRYYEPLTTEERIVRGVDCVMTVVSTAIMAWFLVAPGGAIPVEEVGLPELMEPEGGAIPQPPGGNVAQAPGGNVAQAPGGNVAQAPGGNVALRPGGNVVQAPGGNVAQAPGGNRPQAPGGNQARPPGGNPGRGGAGNPPRMGSNHSPQQWANDMAQRGWTPAQISEAIASGQQVPAVNNIRPGNGATRYIHPRTGRSVVVDNVTGEVIHVGGDGFLYPSVP
jgi:RHS repeat-associated protein